MTALIQISCRRSEKVTGTNVEKTGIFTVFNDVKLVQKELVLIGPCPSGQPDWSTGNWVGRLVDAKLVQILMGPVMSS